MNTNTNTKKRKIIDEGEYLFKLAHKHMYGLNKVKKDINKALYYLFEAAKLDNINAIEYLASIYQFGELNMKEDLEKSFEYYNKLIDLGRKDDDTFIDLIKTGKLEWESKSHFAWKFNTIKTDVEDQILTLLLISKHRNLSKRDLYFMSKHITMIIIKFMCHFQQIYK